MLTTIEGTYRDGQIELKEPAEVPSGTPVIVTFIEPNRATLRDYGINEAEAAQLRAAFATFEDWNSPEMDVYDDYDAAKARL